jgi:hypothetical protein
LTGSIPALSASTGRGQASLPADSAPLLSFRRDCRCRRSAGRLRQPRRCRKMSNRVTVDALFCSPVHWMRDNFTHQGHRGCRQTASFADRTTTQCPTTLPAFIDAPIASEPTFPTVALGLVDAISTSLPPQPFNGLTSIPIGRNSSWLAHEPE